MARVYICSSKNWKYKCNLWKNCGSTERQLFGFEFSVFENVSYRENIHSALHNSIARSGRFVLSSLRTIYTSKYLLNWFLFVFKLYKHAIMQILIATDKSGNQATKTYDRMLWNICPLFSRSSGVVSFRAYVFGSGPDIYNILYVICHWIFVIWKRYQFC
jgi:hypothetical protein